MEKVKVGVIGCGAISGAYFGMARSFPILDIVACSDLDMDRAKAAAEKYGIPRACNVGALLNDDSIELVLNLTVPKAHAPIALKALRRGKHTYCEKPFAISRREGQQVLKLAQQKKLQAGCAPDTFLGSGIQMARKLLDDGAIGRPVAATAYMMCRGHESWHPSPEFYYQVGGGPMFDMGPYYLTALLNLLGPVKKINAIAGKAFKQRTITSKPKAGKKIKVQTPTHISGSMQFASGAIATIIMSFDTRFATHDGKHPITIYGEEGTMQVPDPNGFDGSVLLRKTADTDFAEVPSTFVKGYGRSVGLADLAYAIRSGRRARCDGEQAFAVLDLMQGFLDAAAKGRDYVPVARFKRAAPMPANLPFGTLDE